MTRAFDAHLDMLAADATRVLALDNSFAHNLNACLQNAFSMIEPSARSLELGMIVKNAGLSLLQAHHSEMLKATKSAEEQARQAFLSAIEQLRSEMVLCDPSPRCKALGIG